MCLHLLYLEFLFWLRNRLEKHPGCNLICVISAHRSPRSQRVKFNQPIERHQLYMYVIVASLSRWTFKDACVVYCVALLWLGSKGQSPYFNVRDLDWKYTENIFHVHAEWCAERRAFDNTVRSRKLMNSKRWKMKVIFRQSGWCDCSTTGRRTVVYAIIKSQYVTDNMRLITRDRRLETVAR